MRTVLLVLALTVILEIPMAAQEAFAVGLKGPVRTVLTEDFTSEDAVHLETTGSTLDVYDKAGYMLEFFRYKPDGSIWVHTVYERKGPQVFRMQAMATEPPFESHSEQNVFDSQGRVIETDTYDANGVLVSRSKGEFVEQERNSTTYRRTESKPGGTESTAESVETTDPETGLTHQVETRDGKPFTDWVIQRNKDGTQKDKILYKDGSYNERESKADGTTVEDSYFASTKNHTYRRSDAHHLIEVIEKSGSHYIRCTWSFDKDGRQTGQINYDDAGNVIDKSTTEYHDDSHGNWVEKKSVVWNTKTEPMQPKMVTTSLRTINYY